MNAITFSSFINVWPFVCAVHIIMSAVVTKIETIIRSFYISTFLLLCGRRRSLRCPPDINLKKIEAEIIYLWWWWCDCNYMPATTAPQGVDCPQFFMNPFSTHLMAFVVFFHDRRDVIAASAGQIQFISHTHVYRVFICTF